jgi:hypothetical protein
LGSTDAQSLAAALDVIANGSDDPNLLFSHHDVLSHIAEIDKTLLENLLAAASVNYKDAILPRDGDRGRRAIAIPEHKLMRLQRVILSALPADSVHPAAHAYVPGRSAIECAAFHVGGEWFLKIDIKDFFSQIRESNVRELFVSWGATDYAATALASLVTYRPIDSDGTAPIVDGILPQGAPTSGALANLVCEWLDEDLSGLADRYGFVYTRYSDDMLFSTKDQDSDKARVLEFLKLVRKHVNDFGLGINRKKTRIYSPQASHQYLGVLIGKDGLRLPRHVRKQLERSVYVLRTFGIEALETRYRNQDSQLNIRGDKNRHLKSGSFLKRLVGQIAYVKQVDAEFARTAAGVVSIVIATNPHAWLERFSEDERGSITRSLRTILHLPRIVKEVAEVTENGEPW